MRRRRWRSYGSYVVSKRQELTTTFGGIDRDVEQLFLNLTWKDFDKLLSFYEAEFGKTAATYAQDTYSKWKKGTVRMSGQTAERLLKLLPPLLPYDTRFDLVKKLRNANFRKLVRHISTEPSRWREDLTPVIKEVVDHGASADLSSALKNRLAWLANGDVSAAEKLLAAADRDEARIRLAYLNTEFLRIEAVIKSLDTHKTSASHIIELPQGSIRVHIAAPKKSMFSKIKNWLR